MKVLVTGGAGYIGSHTCVELIHAGHELIVIDNLSNSQQESIITVSELTGKEIKFYPIDVLNLPDLEKVFYDNEIHAVIHFAGLKSVSESNQSPIDYYLTNVTGTINLCEIMSKYKVPNYFE